MTKEEEVANIIGWLEGFSPAVWMIPADKVASEAMAAYDEKVDRLRELLLLGFE